MPGITASLTSPYEAALKKLLSSSNNTDQDIIQQLRLSDKEISPALETAFRSAFYDFSTTYDVDDDGFERMWRLLDIVNTAAEERICDPSLMFTLIGDLLESQTIHGCRKVFDYLESRRDRLIRKNWNSKHLALLRSCNELLRRLSRAEDTVFCGRVFIFLFQSFPLGDKSSVNLRGEYHTDNVTHFDQTAKVADPEAMAVDSTAEDAPQSAPVIKVDGKEAMDTDKLYSTFWSLQEYFAQPTKLFESSNLSNFKSGLEETMSKFKEVYREEPRSGARLDETRGTKRKADNLDGNAFNPKYLTSRDMFELELHDPAFRRHILVQALIVADFLLLQKPELKSRLKDLKNKSVIYDFMLDEADAKWAADMRAEIAAYLQQGTEGKYYFRMVDNVLSRDKNWMRWKAESCPEFQLDPVKAEEFAVSRSGLQKAAAPRQIRKAPMGALDLGFLQDNGEIDPIQKYREEERWSRPELAGFRNSIANTEMDLEMADGEEKENLEEQKSSKIWRALRIGGRFGVLDKLDMESRDGLDPLFGIVKDPEPNDEDNDQRSSEDRATSGTPADELAEVGATEDESHPAEDDEDQTDMRQQEASVAANEQEADKMEVQLDEVKQQEDGEQQEMELRDNGSPESPLSSVESEAGPTADDAWVGSEEEDPKADADE